MARNTFVTEHYLRFPHCSLEKLLSSGIWHYAVWQIHIDIAEGVTAYIIRGDNLRIS
jgi:hypothetical protein